MLIEELAIDLNVNEEIAVVSYEPDDDVKAKKQVTLTTEVIPFYLEKLEAIVKENNGHLALARVSWDSHAKRLHRCTFYLCAV